MEKLAFLLVLFSLIFSLSACASTGSASSTREQEETKRTTQADPEITTAAPTTIKATTVATTVKETEAEISGTRSNPAAIGEIIGAYSDGLAIGITVNSVTRGDDAKAIATEENQFNDIPEGKELILVNVTYYLFEYNPDDDSSWAVSSYDFDFFNSEYAEIKDSETLVIPDEFGGEMYAGASLTGNIYVVVDEGTQVYVRLYDNYWFDLSKT